VKIMPDYTAPMPLWGDWWDLDLPAPLLRELALWQEDFDRSFHWEHGWASPRAREAWAKEAAQLEPLLRRAVGTRAEVVVDLWTLTADDFTRRLVSSPHSSPADYRARRPDHTAWLSGLVSSVWGG